MTEITPLELKLIYLELVLVAIVGVLLFFYGSAPIGSTVNVTSSVNTNTQISSSNADWIINLLPVDLNMGSIMSNPTGQMIVVISIFIIPLTIMNGIIAIRFIADLVKGII